MGWRFLRFDEAIHSVKRVFMREPQRVEFRTCFAHHAGMGLVIDRMICRVEGEVMNGYFTGEVERCGCVETWKDGRLADIREVEKAEPVGVD
jgi:hypothetical protein